MKKCRWSCGRRTKNISGICSPCWKAAEPTRALTDDGYKAWLERRRAKVAKAPSPTRQAASMKAVEARRTKQAEFNAELPVTESFRQLNDELELEPTDAPLRRITPKKCNVARLL